MKNYLFSQFLEIKQGRNIEVIKMLSLQMGGNLLKNQKGVRISLESRTEVVHKINLICTHTFKNTEKKGLRHLPRHRSLIGKGGQLFALVCFRQTLKVLFFLYTKPRKIKLSINVVKYDTIK